MPSAQSLPFLTARTSRVHSLRWELADGDSTRPLPDIVDDWDPQTLLSIAARLTVEPAHILSDCGLSPDSELRCTLVWRCKDSSIRGQGTSIRLPTEAAEKDVTLTAELDGKDLANQVELLVLVTCRPGETSDSLAPSIAGSIVWQVSRTLALEGSASRFPMEWADFPSSPHFPDNAAWLLRWNPLALDESLTGMVRLYLNTRHPFLERIYDGSATEYAEQTFEGYLFFDLARALVSGALRHPDCVDDASAFPDDSVGATVRRLLLATFPHDSISTLSERLQHDPSRFESDLQDRLKFLRSL